MVKKSIILSLILLLGGTAVFSLVTVTRRKQHEQAAYYQSKYAAEYDDYMRKYNHWLHQRAGVYCSKKIIILIFVGYVSRPLYSAIWSKYKNPVKVGGNIYILSMPINLPAHIIIKGFGNCISFLGYVHSNVMLKTGPADIL